MHVASAAEGFVARSGEHDDVDVFAFAAVEQRVADFRGRDGREGVAVARTVDCDAGDAVIEVEQDVVIFLDSSPFSLCHSCK